MHINEILSPEELSNCITEQLVRKQTSGNGLAIYNYTNKAQIFHIWNNVTSACRGLIVDEDAGRIVARPWDKFFNYSQGDSKFLYNYVVMDKLDGSLGILYRHNGKYSIATRGSFTSDQAIRATEMLNNKYADIISHEWHELTDAFTFMFEIICPDSQIVINYDNEEKLVLLGARHIESGKLADSEEAAAILDWGGPVAKLYEPKSLSEFIEENPFNNTEGFVILAENGYMGKIKHEEYIDIHRMIFDSSTKAAWHALSNGHNPDVSHMDNERKSLVNKLLDEVREAYSTAKHESFAEYEKIMDSLPDDYSRKDFAMQAREFAYPSVLFTMLDGRDPEPVIWKSIKGRFS